MKHLFLSLSMFLAFSVQAKDNALIVSKWKSVYTDTIADCVEISAATEDAPIDFYEADCKSFGGYRLKIEGGDLRYGPELSFGETIFDLQRPGSFHDMGSTKIEWVYKHTLDNEGIGKIQWRGLIYRLSAATEDGERDESILYSIRLDGNKSCFLGMSSTNEKARELVYNSKTDCK